MDGSLKVTPEELIATAAEFSAKGSTISNLTSEMTNLAVNLSSIWEGDAATAYVTKFRGLDDDIQMMIRMVSEHASDLEEMARSYQTAESAHISDIGNLSSDVIV